MIHLTAPLPERPPEPSPSQEGGLDLDELAIHQAARAGVSIDLRTWVGLDEETRERIAQIYERQAVARACLQARASQSAHAAAAAISAVDGGASMIHLRLQSMAEEILAL